MRLDHSKAYFVLFFAGLMAALAQALVIKHVLSLCGGSVITIGLAMSSWLASVFAGSVVFSKYFHGSKEVTARSLAATFLLCPLSAVAGCLLVSHSRGLFGILPGLSFSIKDIIVITFSSMFLPAAVSGVQFFLSARYLSFLNERKLAPFSYSVDSLGFLSGSLFFVYVLNDHSIKIYFVAAFVAAAAALLIMPRKIKWFSAVAFLTAIGILFVPGGRVSEIFIQPAYQLQNILRVKNTQSGQIVEAEKDGEVYIYLNGVLEASIPNYDRAYFEKTYMYPFLYVKDKPSVLMLGSPAYLKAMNELGIVDIKYSAGDPFLTQNLSQCVAGIVDDIHFEMLNADPFNLLSAPGLKFDIVFLDFALPVTIAYSKYYSIEFFSQIADNMNESGVLSVRFDGSEVYENTELKDANAVLAQTLQTVFSQVRRCAFEEDNVYICSQNPLPVGEEIADVFDSRKYRAKYIGLWYINFIISSSSQIKNEHVPINSVYEPSLLYKTLSYRQSMFGSYYSNIFRQMPMAAMAIIVFLAAIMLTEKRGTIKAVSLIFIAGAAAMGLHLLSIWALEIKAGNIYTYFALLNAVFMLGCATGSRIPFQRNIFLEIVFFLVILISSFLLMSEAAGWMFCYAVSFIAGLFLGAQFVLQVHEEGATEGKVQSVGIIYAFDLLGGSFAAFFIGAALIPAWGFKGTGIFIALLMAAGFLRNVKLRSR